MVQFDIITLFPRIFESPLQESIIKRARDKGLINLRIHNLRTFTCDRHKTADDTPYGGGAGMLMKVEPIVSAIEAVTDLSKKRKIILTSPQGSAFNQDKACRLSTCQQIIIVCGRYEGVDERVLKYVDEELSVGDFVMTGGEIPAMMIVDSVSRLVPGVVGDVNSVLEDTFTNYLLKYPQYTRPAEFRSQKVPEVLLSGNHQNVRKWRRRKSLEKTYRKRRDLLEKAVLCEDDQVIINEIKQNEGMELKHECD